jgi:hypothetical protein
MGGRRLSREPEYFREDALRVRRLATEDWLWTFNFKEIAYTCFANLEVLIVILRSTSQLQDVEKEMRNKLLGHAKRCPAWRREHKVTFYYNVAAIEKGDILHQICIDLTDVK